MVPDKLHLMSRITDRLTRNLINGTMSYDMKHSRHEPDKLQRPMDVSLLKQIRSCGVSFTIRLEKSEKGGIEFSSVVAKITEVLTRQVRALSTKRLLRDSQKHLGGIYTCCLSTSIY